MVAVGDQGLALGQPLVDGGQELGVPDRPDPVPLLVAVHEVVDGRLRDHLVHDRPDLGGRPVHEEDRCRVERQLRHPVGELVGLDWVDALVREDGPVLGAGGPVRDVQRADQTAHREAARGVLVEVERGLVVTPELSAFLPLCESGGDGPVRSGEEASRGRVADAPGVQADAVEGRQAQRSADVRRDDHGTGVHHHRVVGQT